MGNNRCNTYTAVATRTAAGTWRYLQDGEVEIKSYKQLLYPCLRAIESAVERRGSPLSRTPLSYALVEILKGSYAFISLKYRRPSTPYRHPHRQGEEEEEFFLGDPVITRRFVGGSWAYWPLAVGAGLFWAARVHLVRQLIYVTSAHADQFQYARAMDWSVSDIAVQVAAASATVLVLLGQYLLFNKPSLHTSAQVVALQVRERSSN